MEQHESTHALGLGFGLDVGSLLAGVGLELSTSRAAEAEVDVKETGRTRSLTSNVKLHKNGTGLGSEGLKHEVLDLDVADIARLTDLPDRLGVGLVLEVLVATGHDERPDLADNLDVLGNLDSVGHDVGAVVKVDNLSLLDTIEDSLDGSSIVGLTITLGTLGLDGNKAGGGNTVVLRLALGDDIAVAVEDSLGLLNRSLRGLDSLAVATSVGATLNPGSNLGVASENGSTGTTVLNSDRNGRHVDVVNDEGTVGTGLGRVVVGENANLSVGDLAVGKEDGANVLNASASGHVNSDLGAGDVEAVEGPQPVPVHVDSSLAVAEGHVTAGELLAAEETTVSTTDEGEVGHEATRAVVDEDTLLLVVLTRVLDHLEDNVLKRGGLGNLPVDTGAGALGHTSEVDLEVANLAEEVVLVGVPVGAVVVVGIDVDDSHTLKVGSGLEDGEIVHITNHVSVVVRKDGLGDDIGTGRKVNKSGSDGSRVTALAAATAIREGGVDSRGVIGASITLGTVVLDVAENLVISGIAVGNGTLTLDGGHPPGSSSGGSDRSAVLRSRRNTVLGSNRSAVFRSRRNRNRGLGSS